MYIVCVYNNYKDKVVLEMFCYISITILRAGDINVQAAVTLIVAISITEAGSIAVCDSTVC